MRVAGVGLQQRTSCHRRAVRMWTEERDARDLIESPHGGLDFGLVSEAVNREALGLLSNNRHYGSRHIDAIRNND